MINTIWVSAAAALLGDGSELHPLQSIQEAVDMAGPGTTVLVEAGTYTDNVIVRESGTAEAPLVIRSVEGAKATIVRPASAQYDTFDLGGVDHVVIDGFTIHAPESEKNGIVAYADQSGDGFDPASHITITNNVIVGNIGDGIKGSKAEHLTIANNTIRRVTVGEEAIDFVGVRHARVTGNEILDSERTGVVFKGGSCDIVFSGNLIDGTGKSGIEVGGYTLLPFYWPGFLESEENYEVRGVLISGNIITNTEGTGLRVMGGRDIEISRNEINNNANYVVSIDDSSKYHDTWLSGNIVFEDNSLDRDDWLRNRSDGADIIARQNYTDGRRLGLLENGVGPQARTRDTSGEAEAPARSEAAEGAAPEGSPTEDAARSCEPE